MIGVSMQVLHLFWTKQLLLLFLRFAILITVCNTAKYIVLIMIMIIVLIIVPITKRYCIWGRGLNLAFLKCSFLTWNGTYM